ncbi:MAG: glycosyltransferase family 2 protein [Acidobacteriia bacterium]|nr:glycosyltransferase family 2 protein [Terriglobia bacterium]
MFWFWFFVGPALVLAVLAFRGERERARFVAERLEPNGDADLPSATVIVPLQGAEEGLRESLAALAALDYPDYELIVAVRTASGIPPGVLPSGVIVALGGAKDAGSSDRIRNLLAGIRVSRKRSQILAFVTGDGQVGKNWLRALATPLADPEVAGSTGYCWYVPEPPSFWSLMRSVWSAPIAGLLGPGDNPFVWVGAMALRKETFFELRISEAWRTALSEDGIVLRAVRRAHRAIAFAPGAMVACSGRTSALQFLRLAKRRMDIARVYLPRLWWAALISHVFYCGAMTAAIAASVRGSRGAEWALVAQLGLGMLKGVNRAVLARVELPDREAWFKRHAWVHALWVPLATWVWLWVLLASACAGAGKWWGSRYHWPRSSRARA